MSARYAMNLRDRDFVLPVSANLARPSDVLTEGVVARAFGTVAGGAQAGSGLVLLDLFALPTTVAAAPTGTLAQETTNGHLAIAVALEPPGPAAATPAATALAQALGETEVKLPGLIGHLRSLMPSGGTTFVGQQEATADLFLVGAPPAPPSPPPALPAAAAPAPAPVPAGGGRARAGNAVGCFCAVSRTAPSRAAGRRGHDADVGRAGRFRPTAASPAGCRSGSRTGRRPRGSPEPPAAAGRGDDDAGQPAGRADRAGAAGLLRQTDRRRDRPPHARRDPALAARDRRRHDGHLSGAQATRLVQQQ